MAKRVVFLISDTGGGHRASAGALAEALHSLHGDGLDCQVVDLLTDYAAWPLNRAAGCYEPAIDHHLWLWRAGWRASQNASLWRAVELLAQVWQRGGLRRFAADFRADLYVSVHPLLNHVVRTSIARCHPQARFATVVTDLDSAPRQWYDPGVDLLVAPCPAVQAAALRAGLPASRVRLAGLPIRRQFSQVRLDCEQARATLGLAPRPMVLLLGGGAGIGRLEEIALALAPALAAREGQLAVICGHNDALRSRLAARRWPLPVRVTGYVDDMPLWMAAADLLVTKAGPGTIAEALACGLPLLLSSFVPGQETGNVRYVEENGAGVFCPDPQQIAAVAADWLEPGNPVLSALRARARALARPQAALEIAQALGALLD